MTKQLILISPPGERLTVRLDRQTVESAEGALQDEVTHVVVEPGSNPPAEARREPSEAVKPDKPPPAPPDITMTFVAGGPSPRDFESGAFEPRRVSGPLRFETLSEALQSLPDGARRVLILGRGHAD